MKTLSESYAEHYRAAYAVLEPDLKKVIDKYKTDAPLSKAHELFARKFILTIIDKSEKLFDDQNKPKIPKINGQIPPLKDNEIASNI